MAMCSVGIDVCLSVCLAGEESPFNTAGDTVHVFSFPGGLLCPSLNITTKSTVLRTSHRMSPPCIRYFRFWVVPRALDQDGRESGWLNWLQS